MHYTLGLNTPLPGMRTVKLHLKIVRNVIACASKLEGDKLHNPIISIVLYFRQYPLP